MSDSNMARRADVEITFDGTDITGSILPYLLSVVYTDNEEDETDDLQIKLHNKYTRTATFTIPGNPNVVAGVTVALEDWGGWTGKCLVSQARHSVDGSGYTTQIRLRRVLEGY